MNLKVRFKNPVFIFQVVLAVLIPMLAYFGLAVQDLTSWQLVGETLLKAVSNPYVLGLMLVALWNALNDPTTKGLGDSPQALTYTQPKE